VPEEAWSEVISFLSDFGLLLPQTADDNRERWLDCHPLIREYFANRLRETNLEAWRSAHLRLYESLKENTDYQPDTIEGLQPLYQAVVHGCHAGVRYDAFIAVLGHRIFRVELLRELQCEFFSASKLGAIGLNLSAVACFFERRWSRVSSSLPDYHQAWLLNEAGFCLRELGRLQEAIEPFEVALKMGESAENWLASTIRASNVSELELTLGNVAGAIERAEQSVAFANRKSNRISKMCLPDTRASFLTTLADALFQAGRRAEALAYYRQAEPEQSGGNPDKIILWSVQGFRYCDLLLGEFEPLVWRCRLITDPLEQPAAIMGGEAVLNSNASAAIQRCRQVVQRTEQTLAAAKESLGLLDIALDHLTLSRAALFRSILERSTSEGQGFELNSHIAAALDGLRRSGNVTHVPMGLLTRACVRVIDSDVAGARADLDEAWDIAERGPMRLHLADIHLHRARLFFREKVYPWKSPQADLAAAEKLINDCGYHRRDQELADAKRAILGQG